MDVVGSEIGHKMRSAIKAKLTELGCYVDDELPDYVMVMVANKRTRSQMEDDLQLFLGDNTELFVNWLHQVLKKLQEVTVATPLKSVERENTKERSMSKERKLKDKKDKSKKSDGSKKSKKKAKEKSHKKKEEKKKNKKKHKHEMIRPKIPPLLMNIEKESEPSITDVFAGQILKNHGIILDTSKDEQKIIEQKPIVTETKRPIVPIIDPASIPSQTTSSDNEELNNTQTTETVIPLITDESVVTSKVSESAITPKSSDAVAEATDNESREEKIKEMNEIEAKIRGLKQKLADQLDSQNDSGSDDEDFLNIRTEADELINDFAEDVFQEISQPPPIVTPPLHSRKSCSPSPPPPVSDIRKVVPKDIPETLPQIELNLPKRPIRERLGAPIQKTDPLNEKKKGEKATERAGKTPERLTPEKEPETRPQKSAKSRLGNQPERTERQRNKSTSGETAKTDNSSKRLTSRVSVLENRPPRVTCASVVRVRPRPRVPAPSSSLLLRAVADAHKSLLNIPPKIEPEPQKVKRALVLPMRRSVDPKKIVIQVPCTEASTNNSTDSISDNVSLGDLDSGSEERSPLVPKDSKEEYSPIGLTKVIHNTEYVPSRTLIRRDDTLFVETINIHNTTVDKDKDTQFIVTMDGYHPNAFLAKKLMTEGLLNDDDEVINKHNKSDKTEASKKGPLGVLGSNNNKGTKDITKMLDAKTASVISIHVQSDGRDKSNNNSKEESKKPVSDISDKSKEVLNVEKRKGNLIVTNPAVEKRKNDNAAENPNVGKRKCDISIEKSKTDNSIEHSTIEKRKIEVSLVKPILEKRKVSVDKPVLEPKNYVSLDSSASENDEKSVPPVKKRKASPIIFDVHKKEKVVEKKERTTSSSSDGHVVLTTTPNTHKYDTVPPLSQASKQVWCRAFPQCRYGPSCAFAHPRCKFAAACTRRGCVYSHAANALSPPVLASAPAVASHVVPAANYKTISAGAFANLCKFYPSCSNPACHYYHPKPCRYGKACTNKLECNFYHHDVPGEKWKYSV